MILASHWSVMGQYRLLIGRWWQIASLHSGHIGHTHPKSRKYLDMWKYFSMSIINILSLKWLLKLWSSVNYFFSSFVRPPVMFSIMPVKVTSRRKNRVLKLKLHTLDMQRSFLTFWPSNDTLRWFLSDPDYWLQASLKFQADWLMIYITLKYLFLYSFFSFSYNKEKEISLLRKNKLLGFGYHSCVHYFSFIIA